MTDTASIQFTRTGNLLRVEFEEFDRRRSLDEFIAMFDSVRNGLKIGWWVSYRDEVQPGKPNRAVVIRDLDSVAASLGSPVRSITYASPLQIVLEFVGGGIMAGRGLLYLWGQYQALRVTQAEASLRVEFLKTLRQTLPTLEELERENITAYDMPEDSEIEAVSDLMVSLNSMEFVDENDLES